MDVAGGADQEKQLAGETEPQTAKGRPRQAKQGPLVLQRLDGQNGNRRKWAASLVDEAASALP
jgi:hypothetical protein